MSAHDKESVETKSFRGTMLVFKKILENASEIKPGKATEIIENLIEMDLKFPFRQEENDNVINRALFQLFFYNDRRPLPNPREGFQFQKCFEMVMEKLPESSHLRLAFEELEFWTSK